MRIRRNTAEKLKSLVVGTDFSGRAERALARAAQIAEQNDAKLTVLHVLEQERDEDMAKRIKDELSKKSGELFDRIRDQTSIRVIKGKAFVEIIRQGRRQNADLIVVGAHGEEYLKDLLIGTTAEKIVRKGDRPVLVVRRRAREAYRRILVAVDFSPTSRAALEFAFRVAPSARVHVLHVCLGIEPQMRRAGFAAAEIVRYRRRISNVARRQMASFLGNIDRQGRTLRWEVVNGHARHEIVTFAQAINPDLIVVGSSGRTGLPYILLGSVAEHVMREASCDVLVIRRHRAHFRLP
jgi:nucleotide-binding universal stress UspA family protein